MKKDIKNKTTYYHLIVDKSGSMANVVDVTISTINEQLQAIRNLAMKVPDQKILTGITLFDNEMEHVYMYADIDSIKPITTTEYRIGGMTALLDAIGKSIIALESRVMAQVGRGEASVVVVVITDGYENASRLFNHAQIKSMIQGHESTGLWSFTYLGADLNDISDATRMGFSKSSARVIQKEELTNYAQRLSESMEEYVCEKSEYGSVRAEFMRNDK